MGRKGILSGKSMSINSKARMCMSGLDNLQCYYYILGMGPNGQWYRINTLGPKAKQCDFYTRAMSVGMITKNGLKSYSGGKSAG